MTPNQLYESPPIDVLHDVSDLESHMPEVDFYRIGNHEVADIELRYYARECFDGERGWCMFSVWFNGVPFMICQEAGRGNRDFTNEIITDREYYNNAVSFLVSFYETPNEEPCIDPDAEMPEIANFYSESLWNFYDVDFVPKYRVGDIVLAFVEENHCRWDSPRIKTRCEIQSVSKFNPSSTYRGRQLDRRWQPYGIIVEDIGNGDFGCKLSETDVVELLERKS